MTEPIGRVKLLKTRIYALDAECSCQLGSTVVVAPGEFPLYRDGMVTFWVMRGRLNRQGLERIGDGMFGMRGADLPSDVEVVFPSRRFGPDEWAGLLVSPEFTDGHASQRIQVSIIAEDGAA